jgi:DNA polymerase-3 subunit alpha
MEQRQLSSGSRNDVTYCSNCIVLHAIFRDQFCIEISRTALVFVHFALQNNVLILATNEAFFLDKSIHSACDALFCIDDGKQRTSDHWISMTAKHYLKTSDEMFDLLRDIQEAVENKFIIQQRCSSFPEKRAPLFPKFANITVDEEAKRLKKQTHEGLIWRMNTHSHPSMVQLNRRIWILSQET